MTKNLNTRISEELDEKVKTLRKKYCINISQLIKQCIEDKHKECEKATKQN